MGIFQHVAMRKNPLKTGILQHKPLMVAQLSPGRAGDTHYLPWNALPNKDVSFNLSGELVAPYGPLPHN